VPAPGARTAFFVVRAFPAAARTEEFVGAPDFFDDAPAVFVTAALAGALEAFAFTTAPFLVSAATTAVGMIGLSCRGEGH
jgi:uncharacterized membrane protein